MRVSPAFAQYVNCDSLMQRLDARTKLLITIAVMSVTVIAQLWESLLWISILTSLIVLSAKVSSSELFRTIWSFRFFYVITLLLHSILSKGEILIDLPFEMGVTVEGIERGIFFSIKILLLSLVIMPFFRSTHPSQFSSGALSSVPSTGIFQRISLIFGLAVRFLPMLMDEFERIRWAQVSRGLDIRGSWSRRIRGIGILIAPMMGAAFLRAENLSTAMQSRGFIIDQPRSSYRKDKFGWYDALFCIQTVLLLYLSLFHPLTSV